MKSFLCYGEVHLARNSKSKKDALVYTHVIVKAETKTEALQTVMNQGFIGEKGAGWSFRIKGCLGEATPELLEKYLKPAEVLHFP
jgi:hypothetical protein